MARDYERIPFCGYYRGVGLHIDQNEQRLNDVRAEIDRVIDMRSINDLATFLNSPANSPEARLLACNKLRATLDIAAENREIRPDGISRERLDCYAFLDSLQWRDDEYYGSKLEFGRLRCEGGVRRAERLKDDRQV
jgi:hypothetical protein